MKAHIKAALLSAFVLPGLGQMYKGARIKGGILIALTNLFLLAGLFLVVQGMGQLVVTAKLSGMSDAARVIEELKSKSPAVRGLLAAFFIVWAYGIVDALLGQDDKQGR